MKIVKAYFDDFVKEHYTLNNKIERLKKYNEQRITNTITLTIKEIQVTKTPCIDTFESCLIRYMDYEKEVKHDLEEYGNKKRHILELINTIQDAKIYNIFIMRYKYFLKNDEIMDKLSIPHRTFYRYLNKGFVEIQASFTKSAEIISEVI